MIKIPEDHIQQYLKIFGTGLDQIDILQEECAELIKALLRLLKHMEYLGNVGVSRNLLVWVDGDGCGQVHVTDESGEKLDNVHYSIEQIPTMGAVAGIYDIG